MPSVRLAIFPDNFAKYRVSGFRQIGRIPGVDLTIYSSTKGPSRGNVEVACKDVDYFVDDCFSVLENKNHIVGPHILWTEGLIRAVIGRQFNVVIAWGEVQNLSVWVALILGRLFGKPVLIWGHGAYGNEGWLKKWLRTSQCRLASAVLLYGEKAKALLMAYGVRERLLHVVFNSLDYERQEEIRNSLSIARIEQFRRNLVNGERDRTKILIFVGRLTDRKKGDLALFALNLLRKRGHDYRLIIIGNGPMLESYQKIAANLMIEKYVIFKGATYAEEELALYFMSADLAVCPGAIGLLAVHAFAYGLPVCTHDGTYTRHGPEHEIVEDGQTGCFFREGDVEDFANKVQQWFTEKHNRKEIGKKCIAKVEERYNPRFQAGMIESILKELKRL